METLVIVPQHRNECYGKNCSQVHDRFGSPTGGFRDINCRFQAREGILSTPLKPYLISPLPKKTPPSRTPNRSSEGAKHLTNYRNTNPSPVTRKTPSPSPSPPPSSVGFNGEEEKQLTQNGKSVAIPITFKACNLEKSFSDDFSYSELWAGPTYSNSPPPSSLPIPKFSLRQKRSASLELPVRELGIKIHPVAKSAPSSPRGGSCPSPDSFFRTTAFATKDLRRILNLDLGED